MPGVANKDLIGGGRKFAKIFKLRRYFAPVRMRFRRRLAEDEGRLSLCNGDADRAVGEVENEHVLLIKARQLRIILIVSEFVCIRLM